MTTDITANTDPGRGADVDPGAKTQSSGGHLPGRRRRRERALVPPARFSSYYGRPVLKPAPWERLNIGGYLFLGGLAGASSVLAASAQVTGRDPLARTARVGAAAAISLSLAALVHDLGRPGRFLNMLRVIKPTSPMNMGSWLLAGYAPLALAAAASSVTGRAPALGRAATLGAAACGPAVAAYTSVLVADTAVPAWHSVYRELPFVFVSSAAAAAGGFAMVGSAVSDASPARRLGLGAIVAEVATVQAMTRRVGYEAEPYRTGRAGKLLHMSEGLAAGALMVGVLGRRSRWANAAAGAAIMAASACTRFAVLEAGSQSVADPAYVTRPQRDRVGR